MLKYSSCSKGVGRLAPRHASLLMPAQGCLSVGTRGPAVSLVPRGETREKMSKYSGCTQGVWQSKMLEYSSCTMGVWQAEQKCLSTAVVPRAWGSWRRGLLHS